MQHDVVYSFGFLIAHWFRKLIGCAILMASKSSNVLFTFFRLIVMEFGSEGDLDDGIRFT